MGERRAPLDRLVDLAVAVPTCSLVAARHALPLAARVGTVGTARIVARLSEAVHESRRAETLADESAATAQVVSTEPDDGPADVEPAETISADELPIEGYDDLAARQVVDRLGTLDRADLARIEVYEREHRNRSTVLGKIGLLTA